MKMFCIIMGIMCMLCMPSVFASEIIPCPTTVSLTVYPEEINYGDVFFIRVFVQNKENEIISLRIPEKKTYFHFFYPKGSLKSNEKDVYILKFSLDLNKTEGVFPHNSIFYTYNIVDVMPDEKYEIIFQTVWLPRYEHLYSDESTDLYKMIESEIDNFDLNLYCDFWITCGNSCQNIWQKFRKMSSQKIVVKYRSQEEIELLNEWYLQLPDISNPSSTWSDNNTFVHPFHANGSPFKMEASRPRELGKKRTPFYEAYHQFFKPFESRTEESLERIKRTNAAAEKILEAATQPDSTISHNMVEFIQLRKFLVDMRYAENPDEEEAAFESLMDFVDHSHDKELWIRFVHEVGLGSILHHKYFPWEKVEKYRNRFAERMEILPCEKTD